jgi:predicted MPP superfamily phosphohydrolase
MLFAVVFLGVIAGMNRYLWLRLVRDTRLPAPAFSLVTSLLLVLASSIPLALVVWAARSRSYAPHINFVAFSWLGVSFYLLLICLASDLIRALLWLARRYPRQAAAVAPAPQLSAAAVAPAPQLSAAAVAPAPQLPAAAVAPAPQLAAATVAPAPQLAAAPELDPQLHTRRVFVARSIASGALVAAGGIGAFGMRAALWDITTPEIHIGLAKLPRALDGFSIALLTDVHIGPLLDGRFLRHLVEQTNRLRPDLIAIGGDLVDGDVVQIGEQVAELRRLQSKYGTYFVTGNHEYYAGAGPWIEFLQSMGIQVLMNRHVSIGDLGKQGASFDLAGVPDVLAGRVGAEEPNIERAIAGRNAERELIVMAHQPVQIYASAQARAGLQLSGHTHGGQLFPFGALTRMAQPYLAGLYQHRDTDTQIYVSRGSGFWGPPMRVLAPAEISLLRLHAGTRG